MPHAQIEDGVRLYYELTGPEDAPVILQLGGGLFGRHNFGLVNDGFRERFRLLSFDARGYGASDHPREPYTIEGWAADGAALLDAVGLDRVLVHGTSMGGMIAIAFTAKYPERTIAACADVAFAKPDVYRRTVFRVWRRMAESMPWDDFSDHVTTQAVGARFMESPEGENIFQLVRDIVGLNDPYTVRQACLAMENMDLSPLVPQISRPLLMTNGTHDILCPPDLAPSGLGARKMAELNEHITLVEFPDIGHADLVECPADATRIVSEFFERALGATYHLLERVRPRHPDDHAGELPVGVDVEEVAVVHVVLRAVRELADVALLGRDLPRPPGSTTMFLISWKIETELSQKSVNIRRISSAPSNTAWSVCTVRVASSAKCDRIASTSFASTALK